MRISRRAALVLLAMLLILFLVGTQMPGHSRNAIEASLHAPFPLSKLAHFCMFATEREGSVRDVAIDVAGAVSGVLLTRRPLVA